MENQHGRPFPAGTILVLIGSTDTVGQEALRGAIRDRAWDKPDVAAVLRGRAAAQPNHPGKPSWLAAPEGLAILGEFEPAVSPAEALEPKFQAAAGRVSFDLRSAANRVSAVDLGTGLFQLHQSQSREPEPTELAGFSQRGPGVGPPAIPDAGAAASDLKPAREGVSGIIEREFAIALGEPFLVLEGQFLPLDLAFDRELAGVAVRARDLVSGLGELRVGDRRPPLALERAADVIGRRDRAPDDHDQ